jgi:hypothetical protein
MDNSAPEQPASVGESRRLQDPIPSPQLTVLEQTSPEYDETRLVTHPHFWSHVLRVPARRVLVWAWTTLGVLTGTAVLFWFVRALDAVGLREFGDFMGLSREAMVLPRISRMGLWETLRPAAIAATGAIGWHVAVMGTVATFARATEFQHYQALRKSLRTWTVLSQQFWPSSVSRRPSDWQLGCTIFSRIRKRPTGSAKLIEPSPG